MNKRPKQNKIRTGCFTRYAVSAQHAVIQQMNKNNRAQNQTKINDNITLRRTICL